MSHLQRKRVMCIAMGSNAFFGEHFRNVEDLRAALCSFATRLSRIDSAVLLQCDLAGRAAQDVGREIGLSRRQVQRRRKAVRQEFIRAIAGGESPSTMSGSRREPAKVSASRMQISVRTLWRERKRVRELIRDQSDPQLKRMLAETVAVMERAWLEEDYRSALSAVEGATALADAVAHRDATHHGANVVKAYALAETIERTAGEVRLADLMFERVRLIAACENEPVSALFALQKLRRDLRDPSSYQTVYEACRRHDTTAGHPLAKLSAAAVLDAWNAARELTRIVSSLVRTNDFGAAPGHDVARLRTAILALCTRPEHEGLARRCIADIRALAPLDSRSSLLAAAYESFFECRAGKYDAPLRRLADITARFRERRLGAETAAALLLFAKSLIAYGDARKAGECIEEALNAGHGRLSAKMHGDLLTVASSAMGGVHRRRVAAAFADALTRGSDVIDGTLRA
jgi:hypothetical protein